MKEDVATWSNSRLVSKLLGVNVELEDLTEFMMVSHPIPYIGEKREERLLAVRELASRLMVEKARKSIEVIHGPEDVAHYFMPKTKFLNVEKFMVLLLNTKNHIIRDVVVSTGSLTASIVHPREVFKMACENSAAAMILAHNHPSGDPTPSREDIAVTQRLLKAGKIMDIPVLDHIILGDNSFTSLKEKGLLS